MMRESIAEVALDFLENVDEPKTAKEIAKAVGKGCNSSMVHAALRHWVNKGEVVKTSHSYKGELFQLKKV